MTDLSQNTHEIGEMAVRAIARRLGERRTPAMIELASTRLEVDPEDLRIHMLPAGRLAARLVSAFLTDRADALGLKAVLPDESPSTRLDMRTTGGERPYVEAGVLAFLDPTVFGQPTVFDIHVEAGFVRAIVARDGRAARAVAERVHAEATGAEHPLRGSHLDAIVTPSMQLDLVAVDRPTDSRTALSLPDSIWEEVDVNVHRHLARADQLRALGLGGRRGLLLTGPPGTGKTNLCRIIAAEVGDDVTTIVATREVIEDHVTELYEHAMQLAPSIVFLEDIDTTAHHRRSGPNQALQGLLQALDGLAGGDETVVTVATTNDVAALDGAATRAARIDRIVEVPAPDLAGRRHIVATYADSLSLTDVDAGRIARRTTGATGADIRELFRHALLMTDADPCTASLLEAARARGYGDSVAGGTYM